MTLWPCDIWYSAGYILTHPYAIATSSDNISCQILSISQNAVTPMHKHESHLKILGTDTSSVSIMIPAGIIAVRASRHHFSNPMQCHITFHMTQCRRRNSPVRGTAWSLWESNLWCCEKTVTLRWTIWCLTCLHALVVLFRGGRSVVGFVDGCSEAFVTAPPPDDTRARPVEGDVPVQSYLCYCCLETLERAGLL